MIIGYDSVFCSFCNDDKAFLRGGLGAELGSIVPDIVLKLA